MRDKIVVVALSGRQQSACISALLALTLLSETIVSSPRGAARAEQHPRQMAEFGIAADRMTLAFLRKARERIAPVERLRSVQSLQVDTVRVRGGKALPSPTVQVYGTRDQSRHSIFFPDRMRSDNQTVTSVFNGQRFWRVFHKEMAGWKPSQEEAEEIRQRTLAGFVETSLTLLLRAPGDSKVSAKSAGAASYGALSGQTVEFTLAGGRTLQYVFDEKTGELRGVASRARIVGGQPAAASVLSIERFAEFSTVSGLRMPTRSESTAGGHTATIERRIAINPQLAPTFFAKVEQAR